MPLLPDKEHMDKIEARCLALLEAGAVLSAAEVAGDLMGLEGLPMHCPYHHFLVPAALLTAARMHTDGDRAALARQLKLARELLGVELGESAGVQCPFFPQNRECRRSACPFFPGSQGAGA